MSFSDHGVPLVRRSPSSGASRHLLPQGEKDREGPPLQSVQSCLFAFVGRDTALMIAHGPATVTTSPISIAPSNTGLPPNTCHKASKAPLRCNR